MPNWEAITRRIGRRRGLDPDLFAAQIGQESGFNPNAMSPKGATGIAQIMPETARGWGVDPNRPRQALRAAADNMRKYIKQYGGWENALRAYNAGPGAIEASKGYDETNNYVRTIMAGRTPNNPRPVSGGNGASTGGVLSGVGTAPVSSGNIFETLRQLNAPTATANPDDPMQQQLQRGWDMLAAMGMGQQQQPMASPIIEGLGGGGGGQGVGGGITARAERIDAANNAGRLPYKWGGGHGGPGSTGTPLAPLDCSGAVSRVLGIDPRVSGQFMNWGEPGPGKKVTIYANEGHVLMKIGNRFFGTSKANPGGGAGWIPAKNVSPEYLKGFTVRHPKGK